VSSGFHVDDDALSAALDGEATAGEVAHISACVHCRDRQRELGAAARAVAGATVERRSPAAVDAAVAAALGEAAGAVAGAVGGGGSKPAGGGSAGGVGGEAPFGRNTAGGWPVAVAARSRRRRWFPGAAAAAVAIVVLGVGLSAALLSRGTSGGSTSTASGAAGASSAAGSSAGAVRSPGRGSPANPQRSHSPAALAAPGSAASGSASSRTGGAARDVNPLGSFTSTGPLADALRGRLSARSRLTVPPGGPVGTVVPDYAAVLGPCGSQVAAAAGAASGVQPLLSGSLTYRGAPAVVAVYRSAESLRAVVADVGDCRVAAVFRM
jgi:hypothetical protein